MRIREFRVGDEMALHAVFRSMGSVAAITGVAGLALASVPALPETCQAKDRDVVFMCGVSAPEPLHTHQDGVEWPRIERPVAAITMSGNGTSLSTAYGLLTAG